MENIVQELKRKIVHALAATYAVMFIFLGKDVTLAVLSIFLIMTIMVEIIRFRIPEVNEWLLKLFGGIHRESEIDRPSGILWTLLGCIITIVLIPRRDFVMAALWYLILGDGIAGLVGRFWGRIRIASKSLEGSLACFLMCWGVGLVCLDVPFGSKLALQGALVATLVEALPLPWNDNLWMPVLSGTALWGFSHFVFLQ